MKKGEDIPKSRTYYNQDGSTHTIYFDRKGNMITKEEYFNQDDY